MESWREGRKKQGNERPGERVNIEGQMDGKDKGQRKVG